MYFRVDTIKRVRDMIWFKKKHIDGLGSKRRRHDGSGLHPGVCNGSPGAAQVISIAGLTLPEIVGIVHFFMRNPELHQSVPKRMGFESWNSKKIGPQPDTFDLAGKQSYLSSLYPCCC